MPTSSIMRSVPTTQFMYYTIMYRISAVDCYIGITVFVYLYCTMSTIFPMPVKIYRTAHVYKNQYIHSIYIHARHSTLYITNILE